MGHWLRDFPLKGAMASLAREERQREAGDVRLNAVAAHLLIGLKGYTGGSKKFGGPFFGRHQGCPSILEFTLGVFQF